MDLTLLPALIAFALVASLTPGPNNVMVTASGANFGFHRTLPHMLGISIGFAVMVVLVGLGLMGLFDLLPALYTILKSFSVAYLLYLAWKIANATGPQKASAGARPMTFLQAAAFQWINPKAWTAALTAITLYAPDRSTLAVAMVAIIFVVVAFPCLTGWTLLGRELRRLLSSRARLRAFNWTMAAALVLTLVPVLKG